MMLPHRRQSESCGNIWIEIWIERLPGTSSCEAQGCRDIFFLPTLGTPGLAVVLAGTTDVSVPLQPSCFLDRLGFCILPAYRSSSQLSGLGQSCSVTWLKNNPVSYQLGNLGQVAPPLWASVHTSVKWAI